VTNDRPVTREPMFNAPWPAVLLVAAMVVAYGFQSFSGLGDALALQYGFAPADLDEGRLVTLLTYQFLHGGWPHVGMNAVWAFAFAPPVARLFGGRSFDGLAFFIFYLFCGALAAVGYAAFHAHQPYPPLVGASGAVAGLMGAGSRLLGRPTLAPITDRNVLGMAAVWAVLNIVLGAPPDRAGSGLAEAGSHHPPVASRLRNRPLWRTLIGRRHRTLRKRR
jgi:membrane associated rhomboid family serine protease